MINTHCAHDPVFGYCKREPTPDYDIEPQQHHVQDKDGKDAGFWLTGGHCRLDKATCGFFIGHLEINDTVKEPNFRIVNKKTGETKEVKTKGKGKKKEQIEQGSLF
jgi:hypothetical protein